MFAEKDNKYFSKVNYTLSGSVLMTILVVILFSGKLNSFLIDI